MPNDHGPNDHGPNDHGKETLHVRNVDACARDT